MSADKNLLEELRIDRQTPERKVPGFVWIVLLLLIAIVLFAGWRKLRPAAHTVRTAPVRIAADTRTVLNASGYVTPRREATVSSKVTGKVVEVLIEEGMRVTNGQVLARLDDTNLRASFNLAQAQLDSAKSALAETRVRQEEAQREWKRVTQLAETKIATAADLDHAESALHSFKARLALQETEVQVAERQLALWQQQLEDTVIRAPFAGIVVAKNAQPGEMISPVSAGGGFTRTGICTIVDMESLEIEVDVNESYINRVHPAMPVTAALDAYPDWKIPGKVIAIIPTADRQKSTVRVRVGFDKLDPRILPQMAVKVAFLSTDPLRDTPAVIVSATAVRTNDGQPFVWISSNGTASRRPIQISEQRGKDLLVTNGVSEGALVVIEGMDALSEGARTRETKR